MIIMKTYFIDVDRNGNITDILSGVNIVADKEYDYIFELGDKDILDLQSNYKIKNNKLVEN